MRYNRKRLKAAKAATLGSETPPCSLQAAARLQDADQRLFRGSRAGSLPPLPAAEPAGRGQHERRAAPPRLGGASPGLPTRHPHGHRVRSAGCPLPCPPACRQLPPGALSEPPPPPARPPGATLPEPRPEGGQSRRAPPTAVSSASPFTADEANEAQRGCHYGPPSPKFKAY